MNDSDARARTQQAARDDEQRIAAIVDRRIRETFKNGMPGGQYTGFLWDGMKIVGAGGGFTLDAMCAMNVIPSQTVLGDGTPYRVDYDQVTYDPLSQVTTGASWAFTAAAAGVYFVLASAPLTISATPWVAGDRADLTIQGAVSKPICTFAGMDVAAQPANLLLHGFYPVALDAADVIYIRAVQDCGTDRDIDASIASIVIGHV